MSEASRLPGFIDLASAGNRREEKDTNPLYSMKIAILRILSGTQGSAQHKVNLIGRPYEKGPLEHALGESFTPEQRALADRAFEELKADGLICPTYQDLSSPEKWVLITDAGRAALSRGALDDLDRCLGEISSTLIEMRAGAWEALRSGRSDAVRQAAHSGRELIDQTLKQGAPDELVQADPDFVPDRTSKSGVTRRHRAKFLIRKTHGADSDSDLTVAERAIDLVLAVDGRFQASAHSRVEPSRGDVIDSLEAAEVALRHILGAQRSR